MYNKIEYGDGDIRIDIGSSVIGFDIILSGTYELESYSPHNFYINYYNTKLFNFSIFEGLIFKNKNTFIENNQSNSDS